MRQELYKKVINGREDLWDECCRLRKEVKELVRLNIWREVVEKANTDFDGVRKSSGFFFEGEQKGRGRRIFLH